MSVFPSNEHLPPGVGAGVGGNGGAGAGVGVGVGRGVGRGIGVGFGPAALAVDLESLEQNRCRTDPNQSMH